MSTTTPIAPVDLVNPQNGLTKVQAEALAPKLNAINRDEVAAAEQAQEPAAATESA
jgi:hypothetical protein